MNNDTQLVPYEILPSYETGVVSDLIEQSEIQNITTIKSMVNSNSNAVLTKILKFNLKNIDWDWLIKKYNLK